jgi:hypothetical protein
MNYKKYEEERPANFNDTQTRLLSFGVSQTEIAKVKWQIKLDSDVIPSESRFLMNDNEFYEKTDNEK